MKLIRILVLELSWESVKQCWNFSFEFSAPLPAWRSLFSASRIFCCGRYQPGCTGISDQSKVPPSLSLFLKSEKFPVSLYIGKGPEYRRFCSLGLPTSGTDFKSRKSMYSGPYVIFGLFSGPTGLGHRSQITKGPSPIQKSPNTPMLFSLVATKN